MSQEDRYQVALRHRDDLVQTYVASNKVIINPLEIIEAITKVTSNEYIKNEVNETSKSYNFKAADTTPKTQSKQEIFR